MGEQRELREKILTACRILSHRGLVEAFGHFSARLPGAGTFFITPRRSLALVTRPEHLVEVSLDGRKVSGESDPPLEVHIHSCLYRARADVGAVARAHSFNASVLGVLGLGVRVVHDFGATLLGEARVFPHSDLIETAELGVRLAEFIGQSSGALLRGNGTAVVGRDVVEACVRAVYLEESALIQQRALQLGSPHFFTPDEVESLGKQLLESSQLLRAWEHYRAEADAARTASEATPSKASQAAAENDETAADLI